jgi:hypothetical protein
VVDSHEHETMNVVDINNTVLHGYQARHDHFFGAY